MKISFPRINIPKNNYINNYMAQPILKPLSYDTFEKTSFKGTGEVGTSTHSFEIKNIKNLRCPVCGLIMLTEGQINEFVNDIKDKRGYELVDALEKYEDDSYFTGITENPPKSIFREQKQEIVDIIKDLALQYPRKSLSELVDIEAQKCIDVLIKDQMKVVEELEQYLRKCNATKPKKEEAKEIIEEYKKEILGEGSKRFSRKSFIYDVSNIAYDPVTQARITEIAEKLPTSTQDVNSWFVKYSKSLKSGEIAKKLVQQSIPTAEHLQPKSKDGANSLKNYICDCSECNSKRSDLEFDIWMTTIPNFKENLQRYLQDVQDAIDAGKLSRRNNSYIENIIETIRKLSKDQILLDMPESTDSGKRERMLSAREAKMDEVSRNIKEQSKLKKEKQKEIATLESHPYYQNLFMLETLEKDLEHTKQEIQQSESKEQIAQLKVQINSLEVKIKQCRTYIADADNSDDKIAMLREKIANMTRIKKQMAKLQEEIKTEDELRKMQANYINDSLNKKIENSKIVEMPGFDMRDKSTYEHYLYLVDIYKTADGMYKNYNSKNNKEKERTVILYGAEKISEELNKLIELDSVKYFINEQSIKDNQEEIEKINSKLDEIQNKKAFTEIYERELYREGQGKSIEQLQEMLKNLISAKETITRIHELPQLRSELQNLSDAIAFNKNILHKLKKHYEAMTNEDFTRQINLIY